MKCLSYEDRELIRRARRDGREARGNEEREKTEVERLGEMRKGRRQRIEKGSRERIIEKRERDIMTI